MEGAREVGEEFGVGGRAAEAEVEEMGEEGEHDGKIGGTWGWRRMRRGELFRGFTVSESDGWALWIFSEEVGAAGVEVVLGEKRGGKTGDILFEGVFRVDL